ncbi:MAG: PEP-CTERM sorting domain-containing protein [Phycisphaerae bacterium]|jgi:hypothetical protein
MKHAWILASLGLAALTLTAAAPADLIHDNGPFITDTGNGAGGADTSVVEDGYTTTGIICNNATGGNGPYRVADDITITADAWDLTSMTFFSYQTYSDTTPTFTGAYVTVYDENMQVLYGDWTTNHLNAGDSSWTGAYRVENSDLLNSTRPIMAVDIDLSWLPDLTTGTYWIGVGLTGSLSSGPWAVPKTPHDDTDNAIRWVTNPPAWSQIDGNSSAQGIQPHDLPFQLYGTIIPEPASIAALGLAALLLRRRSGVN